MKVEDEDDGLSGDVISITSCCEWRRRRCLSKVRSSFFLSVGVSVEMSICPPFNPLTSRIVLHEHRKKNASQIHKNETITERTSLGRSNIGKGGIGNECGIGMEEGEGEGEGDSGDGEGDDVNWRWRLEWSALDEDELS